MWVYLQNKITHSVRCNGGNSLTRGVLLITSESFNILTDNKTIFQQKHFHSFVINLHISCRAFSFMACLKLWLPDC